MADIEQAVISYIGDGSAIGCSEAIIDCLCRGDKPERAVILSSEANNKNERSHGFFLKFEMIGWYIVSPGYASGYGGGGPAEFSRILTILNQIFEDMFELKLDKQAFNRLEMHTLLESDIDGMLKPSPIIGSKICLQYYIYRHDFEQSHDFQILDNYNVRLPLTILHNDLKRISFDLLANPISTLREVCAIVEHSLKELSGLETSGTKLFDQALSPRKGKLQLRNLTDFGEQAGLHYLAKGFYQLHRNPIMHKSSKSLTRPIKKSISELLVANHLLLQFSELEDNPEYDEIEKTKEITTHV